MNQGHTPSLIMTILSVQYKQIQVGVGGAKKDNALQQLIKNTKQQKERSHTENSV